jgi:hypothetical protein
VQGVKRPEEQRKRLKRRGEPTKAAGAKQLRDELFGGDGGELGVDEEAVAMRPLFWGGVWEGEGGGCSHLRGRVG